MFVRTSKVWPLTATESTIIPRQSSFFFYVQSLLSSITHSPSWSHIRMVASVIYVPFIYSYVFQLQHKVPGVIQLLQTCHWPYSSDNDWFQCWKGVSSYCACPQFKVTCCLDHILWEWPGCQINSKWIISTGTVDPLLYQSSGYQL
jgi:hypothetical protein